MLRGRNAQYRYARKFQVSESTATATLTPAVAERPVGHGHFVTTHWSVVLAASRNDTTAQIDEHGRDGNALLREEYPHAPPVGRALAADDQLFAAVVAVFAGILDGNAQAHQRRHGDLVVINSHHVAAAGDHLGKGRRIAVEGSLRQDVYEKDGEERKAVSVVAKRLEYL